MALSEPDQVFVRDAINKTFDPATGRLDQKKYLDLVARHFGYGKYGGRKGQAGIDAYNSAVQGADDGLTV